MAGRPRNASEDFNIGYTQGQVARAKARDIELEKLKAELLLLRARLKQAVTAR